MADADRDSGGWHPPLPATPAAGPSRPSAGRGLLAFAIIAASSAVLGLAGGRLWAAAAPRPVYAVTSPGQASLVQPETNAFIAADAWYILVAVIGGVLIGLLGYRFAVRRFGPVPMAGIGIGSTAAAVTASWSGQSAGAAGFNRQLAASRPGTVLHAPVVLGAHSAMAFWPLAALLTAAGIEVITALRNRPGVAGQAGYAGPPG